MYFLNFHVKKCRKYRKIGGVKEGEEKSVTKTKGRKVIRRPTNRKWGNSELQRPKL